MSIVGSGRPAIMAASSRPITGPCMVPWPPNPAGLDLTNVRMSIPPQVDVAAAEPGYLDGGEHGCTPSGELPELNEHTLVTPARRVLLEQNGQNERRALRLDAEAGVEVW